MSDPPIPYACIVPESRSPEGIGNGLRADVDEIAKLCSDFVAAGFIEPMTRH